MTTPTNTSENVAIIAENEAIKDTTDAADSEGDVAARELLVSAMDKVKNDANIHDLLQQLHEKLGFHEDQHNYHQLSPLRETTSTSGSSINTMASANQHHPRGGHHGDLDSSIHHHSSTIDDGDGIDPKSLNSDTIILVCSLVVMILLGILFHQIISYMARLRSRKRQYRRGLKQLGDHMHIVTRTISNPTSVDPTPTGTPSISMRKLALLNNNRLTQAEASANSPISSPKLSTRHIGGLAMGFGGLAGAMAPVPDDDNTVFKPSTHVMRREDSDLHVMTTASQLRHKELHRNSM